MAVSKKNCRLTITISKKQLKWIREMSKKCDISVSNFVKFILARNIAKIAQELTQEEREYLIRIARTPWLDE